MIEITHVTKKYDTGKIVLKDVSMRVEDGSIFGLVGINGAGKSTLLRILAGVMRADDGLVRIDGEDVYENETMKKRIFFLPDDPYFSQNVTANGLAELYRATHDFDNELFYGYLTKFELDPNAPMRNFSKGMKRQVFVSLALAVKPKYLYLDEAFDGLDPLARLVLKKALIQLVEEEGVTVIVASHSLRELEDFCDSYGILDGGEITCAGDLDEAMQTVCKFQAAFQRTITREQLGFECMSFSQVGKVVRIVARGNKEWILKKIYALEPIFVEEIEVDFEEFFIGEVESRGYLK